MLGDQQIAPTHGRRVVVGWGELDDDMLYPVLRLDRVGEFRELAAGRGSRWFAQQRGDRPLRIQRLTLTQAHGHERSGPATLKGLQGGRPDDQIPRHVLARGYQGDEHVVVGPTRGVDRKIQACGMLSRERPAQEPLWPHIEDEVRHAREHAFSHGLVEWPPHRGSIAHVCPLGIDRTERRALARLPRWPDTVDRQHCRQAAHAAKQGIPRAPSPAHAHHRMTERT